MNLNSLEAYATVKTEPQVLDILTEFKNRGTAGANMQDVGKVLGLPHQTSSARGAELKGVTPGETIRLVRTGERANTECGKKADVLIHYTFATQTQLEAHKAWVKQERAKRVIDCQSQISKLLTADITVG